ncbi:unnamed protein product [Malus baccata var. baccata]
MELLNFRSWTNEKHVEFLNSMEESFVRAMFEKKKDHRRLSRLDRYFPDTSNSTLNLKTNSGRMGGRCHKRSRMLSSQPSIASQNQQALEATFLLRTRTIADVDYIRPLHRHRRRPTNRWQVQARSPTPQAFLCENTWVTL